MLTMENSYPKTTCSTPGLTGMPWTLPLPIFSSLEAQEQELHAGLHGVLSHLPVPGKVDLEGLSVLAAMEAGMLPRMDGPDPGCGQGVAESPPRPCSLASQCHSA